MEKRGPCLICTAPIRFTHLGVQSCRACAAFFKRTTTAGRQFICRQGDGQCEIRKHVNYLCRACRYDKCIEIGMTYEKNKRTKAKNSEKEIDTNVASTSSQESSTPSTSKEIDDAPSTSTSPGESRITLKTSLIDRMETEYKASYARRVVLEKEFVETHKLPPFNHPTEEFYTANFDAFYELFRIAIKESTDLLKNVIDDFESFPIAHRVTLFKDFVRKFSMIECVYLTTKHCKETESFMASLITCAGFKDMNQWTPNVGNCSRKDALQSTVRAFTDDYEKLMVPMMMMDELTDQEFYAILVLCYCDVDISQHLPDEIIASTLQIRSDLFEELQKYYRNELKMSDFSKRIGDLMTMVHGAGEASIVMNEEMRMYTTMFDVYSDDQFFREFFSE